MAPDPDHDFNPHVDLSISVNDSEDSIDLPNLELNDALEIMNNVIDADNLQEDNLTFDFTAAGTK